MVLSLARNANADISGYLFGSIFGDVKGRSHHQPDLAARVLILFILYYRRIFTVTFDEAFAQRPA